VPLLLGDLLVDLMSDAAYDAGANPEPSTAVQQALDPVRALMPAGVPSDLMVRGLMVWTYLFGAVSFEVFGHRHNVIAGPRAFFDHEVRRLATMLGLATGA